MATLYPTLMGTFTAGTRPYGGYYLDDVLEETYQMDIYKMIVEGVRQMDEEQGNGLLEKICDAFEMAWEEYIFNPATNLTTIFEPENIDAKWIEYIKPLLGFTKDIPFEATTAELRTILTHAMDYWGNKPTEYGVIDRSIRFLTNKNFRAGNFFDFRMSVGATVLGEEIENFDPWLIDFGNPSTTGVKGAVTGPNTFDLKDLSTGTFDTADDYKWLVVIGDSGNPDNEGIYKIRSLTAGGTTGIIYGAFAVTPSTEFTYKVLSDADEMRTEVRLVDHGVGELKYINVTTAFSPNEKIVGATSKASGYVSFDDGEILTLRNIKGRFVTGETLTGMSGGSATSKGVLANVLNRSLLKYLAGEKTSKPISERIDIVYIDFLDQFLLVNDLSLWDETDSVTVPSPGGAALIASGGYMRYTHPDNLWGDHVVLCKWKATSATTIAKIAFMRTSASSYYEIEINYTTKVVALYEGAFLLTSVTLPYLKYGVSDVIRIVATKESSDTRIKVTINGDPEIDYLDAGGLDNGGIEFSSSGDSCSVEHVEVFTLPVDVDRIGPNP